MRAYQSWKIRGEIKVTNPPPSAGYIRNFAFTWQPGLRRDFRDVRFVSITGDTLPFFRETVNPTVTSSVWVAVPPHSKFYYYIGNGAVLDQSAFMSLEGQGYCIFADNLESGTAAPAKWDVKINTVGPATAGITTAEGYDIYSMGVSHLGGQGDGAAVYDQCHTLIKIPLTLIPVGTSFIIRHIAKKTGDTTSADEFCGLGLGGTDADSELYDMVAGSWAYFETYVTRSGTDTWDFIVKKGGPTVLTVTKTRTFDTYFTYGLQTRHSGDAVLAFSAYIDNIFARITATTEPTLTVGNSYPNPANQYNVFEEAAAPDTESAQATLAMTPSYSLQDAAISAQAGQSMTPGYSLQDQPISAAPALQMSAGYSLQDAALSLQTTLQMSPALTLIDTSPQAPISEICGLVLTASAEIIDTVLFDFLDDMAGVLEAAGITASIYTGWQPPTPGTCVTLYEYSGRPADTIIPFETPGLQARIRQAEGPDDYQKAKMLANQVMAALHDKTNFQCGQRTYIHATAQQSPFFLNRDANNRPEFIINFLVKKIRN